MPLSVVNWNLQWATPKSRRTPEILRRIERHAPELVCLTEAHEALLSGSGHALHARPDYGYAAKAGRRKVMLWSREPWREVDDLGNAALPPGRFISGVTRTSLGDVAVVGVCIPWFGSRTEAYRGTKRKERWDDHADYLAGLTALLKQAVAERLLVVGDFNQAIGKGARAPIPMRTALRDAFPPTMRIATTDLAFDGRSSIDHIALSPDWRVDSVEALSNLHDDKQLSDHFGVAANLSIAD